jgi:hypothetical protein
MERLASSPEENAMSLTAHLKDKESPVRQFLYTTFPNSGPITAETKSYLSTAKTILPAGTVQYAAVGMALDYRIRYCFGVTPPERLTAYEGALVGILAGKLAEDLVRGFFTRLKQSVARIKPVQQRLDAAPEATLNRYCYTLGLFELLYRAGPQVRSPLFAARSVDDLLAIAPAHAIDDLCELSWGFHASFEGDLTRPAILNPSFAGSGDVGGADADLILDGCLMDVKATTRPALDRSWLYQLLGYVLLDYTDECHIREVAIHMARQRVTLKWPLVRFLATMSGDDRLTLCQVRARFQEAVRR